ncbi:hypothetical protein J5Y03_00655 [Bacillus sp. RG28]|uniref:Uncharacterized protein n=1 Tax=Gottfriedia endophytica TaxID=2820819 RepID=A0A940SHN7_9BACI|nr:hypothetical protein [Gottfriedia endophytica]
MYLYDSSRCKSRRNNI